MKKGFTLLEVLVVSTIIALLASTGLVYYGQFERQSRDVKRRATLEELRAALEMYKTDHDSYPSTGVLQNGPTPRYYGSEAGTGGFGSNPDGTGFIPGLAPDYIPVLPKDPIGGSSTVPIANCTGWLKTYGYMSDGIQYKLVSRCSSESLGYKNTDPYYDPFRPQFVWSVSSSSYARTNW